MFRGPECGKPDFSDIKPRDLFRYRLCVPAVQYFEESAGGGLYTRQYQVRYYIYNNVYFYIDVLSGHRSMSAALPISARN